MPFVLAADIGFVAVGVILFLLCVGGSYLIDGIASRLPVFGFLGLKLDLAAVFRKITWPVVAFITTIGALHFNQVEQWLRGIAYTLIQTVFGSVQTQAHHATQISHIVNSEIPKAMSAAEAIAAAHVAEVVQGVRAQIHVAQVTWEQAHSYADAVSYIDTERLFPSVENAFLAGMARTLIAAENHAQDLHDQLYDYIGRHVTGQADVAKPYTGQTLTGVAGAIAIPGPVDLGSVDVQDIIKTGSQIAVGTAVAVIATKIVECLVSKCAGNNNFDNLLKDALGLLGAVEFATFVEAFVKDPAGTITAITDTIPAIAQTGVKTADDVWGDIAGVLGL